MIWDIRYPISDIVYRKSSLPFGPTPYVDGARLSNDLRTIWTLAASTSANNVITTPRSYSVCLAIGYQSLYVAMRDP
jgi:hypothetical protein